MAVTGDARREGEHHGHGVARLGETAARRWGDGPSHSRRRDIEALPRGDGWNQSGAWRFLCKSCVCDYPDTGCITRPARMSRANDYVIMNQVPLLTQSANRNP